MVIVQFVAIAPCFFVLGFFCVGHTQAPGIGLVFLKRVLHIPIGAAQAVQGSGERESIVDVEVCIFGCVLWGRGQVHT